MSGSKKTKRNHFWWVCWCEV